MTVDLGMATGSTRFTPPAFRLSSTRTQAVLNVDFAEATDQLETTLATATVPTTLGLDIGTKEAAFAVD